MWQYKTYVVRAIFGFGILIFIAFMFLLKWVLKQQDRILKNAEEERKVWQTLTSAFQSSIAESNQRAQANHEQNVEAHKYQREEHQKMINQLDGITLTLVRLNGKE